MTHEKKLNARGLVDHLASEGDGELPKQPGRRPDFSIHVPIEFELVSNGHVTTKPTWLNNVGAGWLKENGNISILIGHMRFLLKPAKRHG